MPSNARRTYKQRRRSSLHRLPGRRRHPNKTLLPPRRAQQEGLDASPLPLPPCCRCTLRPVCMLWPVPALGLASLTGNRKLQDRLLPRRPQRPTKARKGPQRPAPAAAAATLPLHPPAGLCAVGSHRKCDDKTGVAPESCRTVFRPSARKLRKGIPHSPAHDGSQHSPGSYNWRQV